LKQNAAIGFQGNTIYRTDRPGIVAFGGTMVLVRRDIKAHAIDFQQLISLEATAIEITTSKENFV
jgi:alanine racemase